MSKRKVSIGDVVAAYKKHKSIKATAEALGLTRNAIRYNLKKAGVYNNKDVKESFATDFKDKSGVIESKSTRITTLEQALEFAEVDLDVWEVERHIINKWEVGAKTDDGLEVEPLFQVKVWLKRKVVEPFEKALEAITARLEKAPAPVFKYTPKKVKDPCLLEISLYDHHFGKLAWSKETGEDYDLAIADKLYSDAVEDLLHKVKVFNIDKIILPIGNDFFHINSMEPFTAAGTLQDVDSRLPKIFDVGCRAVVNTVGICAAVADVELVWVPGNHDPQISFFMAKYLAAYFRKACRVEVDARPCFRKYKPYGINLIGYTHGNEEPHRDLPTLMAVEARDLWAQARHCEWHVGHLHKKKETRYNAGDTFGGVVVRILPSLAGTDAWHFKKGYVGSQRAAEATLFSKEHGNIGQFTTNIGITDNVEVANG